MVIVIIHMCYIHSDIFKVKLFYVQCSPIPLFAHYFCYCTTNNYNETICSKVSVFRSIFDLFSLNTLMLYNTLMLTLPFLPYKNG